MKKYTVEWKKIVIILMVVLTFVFLTSCGRQEAVEEYNKQPKDNITSTTPTPGSIEGKKVALICATTTHEGIAAFLNEAKDLADQLKWELIIYDAAGDYGNAISAVQNYIQMNVDAIVNVVLDNKQLGEAVTAANRSGIPFVSFVGGYAPGITFELGTGSGIINGVKMGQWLVDKIEYEGNVMILGFSALEEGRNRAEAMEFVASQYDGVRVVLKQDINFIAATEEARTFVQNYLLANQGKDAIKAIFCVNDELALGASLAVQEDGRAIVVVGMDGSLFAYDAIRKGTPLKATATSDRKIVPKILFSQLERIFSGLEPTSKLIISQMLIVDENNLPPEGEYPESEEFDWQPPLKYWNQ